MKRKRANTYTWVNTLENEDPKRALKRVPGYQWANEEELKTILDLEAEKLLAEKRRLLDTMIEDHLAYGALGGLGGGALGMGIGSLAGMNPAATAVAGTVAGSVGMPLYRRFSRLRDLDEKIKELREELTNPTDRRLAVLRSK